MAGRHYDPMAFKAQQREQWSNVAQGWRRRWATFEQGAQPLSDRMMELAHVTPGKRVLDVATGIGEPAMTAARRVGPGGAVMALDQAPQMLAIAHERIRTAGIGNVEFVEGDAERVGLPQDTFDAVVCRWGLMFFTNPVGTLSRLRATLVPGGWLAAAVWGAPGRVPLISLSFAVLSREPGSGPRQLPAASHEQTGATSTPFPAGPNPFALAEPAALERVVRDAGFAEVQSEPYTVTFEFSSAHELVEHLEAVSAPVRATMGTLSPERQIELRTKLAEAAGAFADASGTIRLPNVCLIVAGRR